MDHRQKRRFEDAQERLANFVTFTKMTEEKKDDMTKGDRNDAKQARKLIPRHLEEIDVLVDRLLKEKQAILDAQKIYHGKFKPKN